MTPAIAAAVIEAGRALLAERRQLAAEEAAIRRVKELWPGAAIVRITEKPRHKSAGLS